MKHVRCGSRRAGIAILCLWLVLAGQKPVFADSRVPELIHRALTAMPDTGRGERMYTEHCAKCHLMHAEGSATQAVPALAGQHSAYVVEQLAAFIEFERDDSSVHRFLAGGELSQPQTLMDIAAYVETLPAAKPAGRGSGKSGTGSLPRGKELYLSSCAACHQPDADGDAEQFVPALHGQNHAYLLAQLRRMAHGHRFAAPDELVDELNHMSSSDMEAVALYLEQLPATGDSAAIPRR